MNPFDFVNNLKNMQEQMKQMKEDMNSISVTGSAGGNMVQITLDGAFSMKEIKIDPIAVDPRDVKMLQDIIIAAHNDASAKLQEKMKEKTTAMLGGMDLGSFGLQ